MSAVHDLVGVGVGPFNLGLAALAHDRPGLDVRCFERTPEFRWHPGLLLEGARLQVPFLADLVTLVDPTSPFSFLAYLREHDRLFPFYFAERFHPSREEYDDYCRWVARSLPSLTFGAEVRTVCWDADGGTFVVDVAHEDGRLETVRGRGVVLGVGTAPHVPDALADAVGDRVVHAADYLGHRDRLLRTPDVTVVGSGQSGAEVVLDLLRRRRREAPGGLRWITRTPAFAPMEYSKLGLEHFTPDYTAYFRDLPGAVRARVLPEQWQLYKAVSAETLADIHDELYARSVAGADPGGVELRPGTAVQRVARDGEDLVLHCHERRQDRAFAVRTGALVLATGYVPREPACLDGLGPLVLRDGEGRTVVDAAYRLALAPHVTGRIYVQNGELHTHGVGAPDLGLGAHRNAVILNDVAGRMVHRLPRRTAFTSFGAPA